MLSMFLTFHVHSLQRRRRVGLLVRLVEAELVQGSRVASSAPPQVLTPQPLPGPPVRVDRVDRVDRVVRVDRVYRVDRLDWVDWVDWVVGLKAGGFKGYEGLSLTCHI